MPLNKNKHHRGSIRLKGYDYASPGWYYITICTHSRECFFGDVNDGKMVSSQIGKTAKEYWLEIPDHFTHVELDEFVVMPNHIHGIVIINDDRRGVRSNAPTDANIDPQNYFTQISPKSGTLGVIIRSYKSSVTRWCRKNEYEYFQWQRGFYEHIIRNEPELYEIRKYIINNPAQWQLDNEHPDNVKIQ